jgi:hypothetical protein
MAVHERNGQRIAYVWRFGLTPAWLDRADTRVSRWIQWNVLRRTGLTRAVTFPRGDG